MADRIKLLVQKRTSLKSQITLLTNLFDKGKLDNATLKMRSIRLAELFRAYEEFNDELVVLDPSDGHHDEFAIIQERYYAVAGKIENVINAVDGSRASTNTPNDGTRLNDDEVAASTKRRRIKLPEAPLPTFDGKYENWLAFKNAFTNMVGSRTDLSDIDKLYYLKSGLIGDAANKVKVFAIDGTNFAQAWELLERAYEVKRILIARHLLSILNLSVLDKETSSGLSKIADEVQQHTASLNALGVSVGPEMIVQIVEGKLPRNTLDKWEATLERDEFPKPDQLFEFLYKTAVCASKRERSKSADSQRPIGEPLYKRRQNNPANKAFVLGASHNCVVCKTKRHPLYLCDKFKRLPVSKRIETVRNAKLCYNCLRSHRDKPCKFSNCTICQKRHNTLLHLEGYTIPSKSDVHANTSDATKSESDQCA